MKGDGNPVISCVELSKFHECEIYPPDRSKIPNKFKMGHEPSFVTTIYLRNQRGERIVINKTKTNYPRIFK
jgi:hypothetical protein